MANLIDSGLVRIQAFAELVMGFLDKSGDLVLCKGLIFTSQLASCDFSFHPLRPEWCPAEVDRLESSKSRDSYRDYTGSNSRLGSQDGDRERCSVAQVCTA
jgi:hypothetical protein